MKPVRPACKHLCTAALASTLLAGAGVVHAAPLVQASPDPARVGSVFSLDWSDAATIPSVGYTGFDVLVGFDPAVVQFVSETTGSAFGNATTSTSFDFDHDGFDDPGWALFHVARNAGAQPLVFGTGILRVDFLVLGVASGGATDVTFFTPFVPPIPVPAAGDYLIAGPGGADSVTAIVGITANGVPEPGSLGLMLAGLGALSLRTLRRRP